MQVNRDECFGFLELDFAILRDGFGSPMCSGSLAQSSSSWEFGFFLPNTWSQDKPQATCVISRATFVYSCSEVSRAL
jgi:hypothetical protein